MGDNRTINRISIKICYVMCCFCRTNRTYCHTNKNNNKYTLCRNAYLYTYYSALYLNI